MKPTLVLALAVALSLFGDGEQSSSSPNMKEAIAAQQQQIQSRDAAIHTLEQRVSQAEAAQAAQQTTNAAVPKAEDLDKQYIDPLQHEGTDLKAVSPNTVEGLQDTQKRVGDLESPGRRTRSIT